jgi:Serine dehydrogenase proteinase
MELSREAHRLVDQIATSSDADILLVCGDLDDEIAASAIAKCEEAGSRPNVLLIFITLGGNADAAYRFARYLQNKYRRFSIFIPRVCKSAGTLVAIGAHEVIIGPFGEIGPLDVQFYKVDELDEIGSGLVANASLKALESTAIDMFERYFLRLKSGTGGLITLKTATSIASDFVAKLLAPVYSQIDPFRIGENDLDMRVARDYGERLAKRSGNLQSRRTLTMLVESYPSHDFVIDSDEVETIFNNVRRPDNHLARLAKSLQLDSIAESYDDDLQIAVMLTSSRKARRGSVTPSADEADPAAEQPRQLHKIVTLKRDSGA